jgi:hypothetical protein
MTMNASALSVGPAKIDLSFSARDLRLGQGKDANGEIVLTVESAGDGKIKISTSPRDLEALIAEIAKSEAGRHGVTIDRVQLILTRKDSHSVAAEVQLRARKLFLSASIRLSGQLDLDEKLNARISGLTCTGDGAIASLACGVLAPHLQKLERREFALMSLPLGEVRLRDLRLSVGETLTVAAEFGSEKAALAI